MWGLEREAWRVKCEDGVSGAAFVQVWIIICQKEGTGCVGCRMHSVECKVYWVSNVERGSGAKCGMRRAE